MSDHHLSRKFLTFSGFNAGHSYSPETRPGLYATVTNWDITSLSYGSDSPLTIFKFHPIPWLRAYSTHSYKVVHDITFQTRPSPWPKPVVSLRFVPASFSSFGVTSQSPCDHLSFVVAVALLDGLLSCA